MRASATLRRVRCPRATRPSVTVDSGAFSASISAQANSGGKRSPARFPIFTSPPLVLLVARFELGVTECTFLPVTTENQTVA